LSAISRRWRIGQTGRVFERELRDRRDWCENNTTEAYEVGPIGPDPERLTGRRFKFTNQRDAALFKLFFPTVL
jgi:hypothetical protein